MKAKKTQKSPEKLNIKEKIPALAEKQSVRTTLNLSKKTTEKIKTVTSVSKITIKEFFEYICDESNLTHIPTADVNKLLESKDQKTRQTYVISKKSLNFLNKYSKKHRVKRDNFAELLVHGFMEALLENLRKGEESKKNHKKALDLIISLDDFAGETEKKLKQLLVPEDPIIIRYGYIMVMIMNLIMAIESELKDGTEIDPEEF